MRNRGDRSIRSGRAVSALRGVITALSAAFLVGSGGALTADVLYVPASAHAAGVNGASWRTDVEVHNPGAEAAAFTIELLRQNTDNGGSVPSRSVTLGGGTSRRYTDILSTVFGVEGAAALRFTTTTGKVLVTSRTYNLVGPNGVGLPVGASFGQFVPGLGPEEAIGYGEEGRLIQLTHQAASTLEGFRTNVGIVNASPQTIDVTIDLYAADGTPLGSVAGDETRLRPYEFKQLNALIGRYTASCADAHAVLRTTTAGGSFYAFASVVDNHTSGDPIFVPAIRIGAEGPLALFAPVLEGPLLSGVKATLVIGARRATDAPLAFTLAEAPEGAAIDATSGVITWTPPASAEGTQARMRATATDGETMVEVAFTVAVASTSPAASSLAGSTLTVTGTGTLQGISLALPADLSRPASGLRVSSAGPDQAPPIPAGVTRLSDFFRLTPVEAQGDDGITVALPARLVPPGVRPSELMLFFYTEETTGLDGPAWIGVANELDVLPGGTVTIKVYDLGDLCFVGYRTPSRDLAVAGQTPEAGPSFLRVGALGVTVSCTGKRLADGSVDPARKVCTVTGDDFMTITVKDFDPNPWQPAATIEELIGWLVAGRQKLLSYGMSASPVFEVVVEQMPKPSTLGFVAESWSGKVERRRVLHLSETAPKKESMQGTSVHEYFHHAQSRTRVAGRSNVIADVGEPAKWLFEGTARWFEDEVFDTLDTYLEKERNPLRPVLASGLDARDTSGVAPPATADPRTRSYARFAFFKLVSGHCPGIDFRQLFNWDAAGDPTGAVNFAGGLASADWRCDFGPGFGDASRTSLASAMLYYEHATQKQNDVTLLDASENGLQFQPPTWKISPAECPQPAGCPASATTSARIGPKSAWALEIQPVANLGDREVALEVEIGTPPVWVWIGDDVQHKELGQGTWLNAVGVNRYVYGQGGSAPRLFIAVVNPSFDHNASVTVRAVLRPTGSVVVPFSFSSQDHGRDSEMADVLTWTIESSGTFTGPAGITLSPNSRVVPGYGHSVGLEAHGLKKPYQLGVTGRFDAVVDRPTGSKPWNTSDTLRWSFSNKRLLIDCLARTPSPTPASPAFGFSWSSSDAAAPSWFLCVTYDLRIEIVDSSGRVIESGTREVDAFYLGVDFLVDR